MFVSRERSYIITHKRLHGAPDWVIEILLPKTHEYDLNAKRKLYEETGVSHYWVIDPDNDEVLYWNWNAVAENSSGVWNSSDSSTASLLLGFALNLEHFFNPFE